MKLPCKFVMRRARKLLHLPLTASVTGALTNRAASALTLGRRKNSFPETSVPPGSPPGELFATTPPASTRVRESTPVSRFWRSPKRADAASARIVALMTSGVAKPPIASAAGISRRTLSTAPSIRDVCAFIPLVRLFPAVSYAANDASRSIEMISQSAAAIARISAAPIRVKRLRDQGGNTNCKRVERSSSHSHDSAPGQIQRQSHNASPISGLNPVRILLQARSSAQRQVRTRRRCARSFAARCESETRQLKWRGNSGRGPT